jgi:hypothetical protein
MTRGRFTSIMVDADHYDVLQALADRLVAEPSIIHEVERLLNRNPQPLTAEQEYRRGNAAPSS